MKRALALILAMVMLLALAACNGTTDNNNDPQNGANSGNQSPGNGSTGGTGNTPPDEPSSTVVDVVQADKYKENIDIALTAAVTTLDPGLISNVQHFYLFNMVYNTLVRYNDATKELEPELATEWSWTDDTCTAINVKLRSDVTFHNGEKMTAEDVAFSLDRTTSSLITGSYDHCEVKSDTELTIFLKAANVDFLFALSHNSAAVVSKKAVEADADMGGRFGTGPWVIDMDRYVAGDTIVLVRNEDYWGEKPNTKTVTMHLITNASSRLIALENGEVSLMTSVADTEVELAKGNKDLAVYEYSSTQMYYFAFNTSAGPGTNETLRQAVAYAINGDDLMAAVGDTGAMPATSFWGWHMANYNDKFDVDLSYNPEKAKELVGTLGDNTTIHLMVNTGSNAYATMSQVIQDQCRQVGITVIIDEVDSAGISANTKFSSATHEAMLYSISMNDWDDDMARLLTPKSNTNKAVLTNERVIELLSQGRSTSDKAARAACYKELQTIVHDACYYIPLFYTTDTLACDKNVSGITVAYNRGHDYSYICIPE